MKLTRRTILATVAALPLMAQAAMADGLISIIVNDPANPYWYTEGHVAKATAEELGYEAQRIAKHVEGSQGPTDDVVGSKSQNKIKHELRQTSKSAVRSSLCVRRYMSSPAWRVCRGRRIRK